MLRPEDARAPHLDAVPGGHEVVRQAAAEVRDALTADCPERPARLDSLTGCWQRAKPLLAESRKMLAEDAPHGSHLAAMTDERAALVEAGEMDVLSTVAHR